MQTKSRFDLWTLEDAPLSATQAWELGLFPKVRPIVVTQLLALFYTSKTKDAHSLLASNYPVLDPAVRFTRVIDEPGKVALPASIDHQAVLQLHHV